jgi:hypothetical protein
MAIDRKAFFEGIRNEPFPGSLSEETVRGITAMLDEWERRGLTDLRWLAYMLATVLRECGRDMLPIRDIGQGRGKKYGAVINGHVYYGRGLVQLTWEDNYHTSRSADRCPPRCHCRCTSNPNRTTTQAAARAPLAVRISIPDINTMPQQCPVIVFSDFHQDFYDAAIERASPARFAQWKTLYAQIKERYPPIVFTADKPVGGVSRIEIYDLRPDRGRNHRTANANSKIAALKLAQ